LRRALHSWHDWCCQRGRRANSDANADTDADSNGNTESNTIGHTTTAHSHANGNGHSFANSHWKTKTDATRASNTTRSSLSQVGIFSAETCK